MLSAGSDDILSKGESWAKAELSGFGKTDPDLLQNNIFVDNS